MRPGVVRTAALAGLLVPLLLAALADQAGAATAPSDRCLNAQQVLEAGRYQLASTLYTDDTDRTATLACGRAGLVATSALSAAGQLLSAGLTGQAGAEIARALDEVPLLRLPADLASVSTSQQDEALAETLYADGFHAQAVSILQRAISADPSFSRSLNPEAKNILGLIPQSWYVRIWHVISSPEVIVAWLVVLAALVNGIWQQFRRRLYLQHFTALEGIDPGGTLAVMLRSLTREELGRLARDSARSPGGRRLRLHLAGPYDDRNKIDLGPLAGTLSAPMQQLYQVITLLTSWLGSRSRLVTGTLHSHTSVDVALERIGGKDQHSKVIDSDAFGFPGDRDFRPRSGPPQPVDQLRSKPTDHRSRIQQLALAAAAWIILERYRRRKINLGGTTDWESYVAFVAGCTWEAAGTSNWHRDRARNCYLRARGDPANTAAAINLAAMLLADDVKSKTQLPIQTLRWYQMLTAIVETPDRRRFLVFRRARTLQWYRARYLLAMGLRDFMEAVQPAREVRNYFEDRARELTADVAIELEKHARSPRWLPRDFVNYGRTAAISLLARQVMTWTTDPGQVVTTSRSPGFTKETIRGALRAIRDGAFDRDTSAKLAEFASTGNLEVDDQSEYQLARYRRRRYEICVTAIESYDLALKDNAERRDTPILNKWRDGVRRYQDLLEEQAQEELIQAKRYQREVEEAGDPFLAPEIERLPELERAPPGPENRHHPAYGTPEQQPPPAEPPEFTPPPEAPPPQPDRDPVEPFPPGSAFRDALEHFRLPADRTHPDLPLVSADGQLSGNATRETVPSDEPTSPVMARQERYSGPYAPASSRRASWWGRLLHSIGLARGPQD
jgi:hypothetical protein